MLIAQDAEKHCIVSACLLYVDSFGTHFLINTCILIDFHHLGYFHWASCKSFGLFSADNTCSPALQFGQKVY